MLYICRSPKPSHRTRPHPRTSKKRMPTIPISFTKKQFCLFARKKLTKEAAQVLVQRYVYVHECGESSYVVMNG